LLPALERELLSSSITAFGKERPMTNYACKACIDLSDLPRDLQRAALIAVAAVVCACSSMPPPTEQMNAARAAVAQAQPVAAAEGVPEFGIAQAKLAGAEHEMQRGDNVAARVLAEQAEVDARYAWALAENARLQRTTAELDRSAQRMREELERSAK
jgi:hypothetical protein